MNCGMCGKQCGSLEACVNGNCTSACLMNQTKCTPDGGAPYCTNTQTDNANCGTCGKQCASLEACVNGNCSSSCLMGQTKCTVNNQTFCANLQTDNANCGQCGNVCGGGQKCVSGTCQNANKFDVLLCYADQLSWAQDVQTRLTSTNAFGKVDLFNCGASTPTLNQLTPYGAVLTWSNQSYSSGLTLGNNLADYVDAGGYAVVAVFANASIPLAGRWSSGGYNLINPTGQTQPAESQALQLLEPMSPLVANVSTLTATSAFKSTGGVVNGGVIVARWGSSAPLIVRGVKNNRLRAELNMFPPSSTSRNDFWVGDATAIMRNALLYR